jgi:hypothetical protein
MFARSYYGEVVISLRAPAAVCVVLAALGLVGACSSSSKAPATPSDPGASDAAAGDAPLGPLVCDLPVAASCPATAPCSFAAWGCALPACDGYVVVTDGKWVYYYSSYGGALVGVVAAGDAGEVACP